MYSIVYYTKCRADIGAPFRARADQIALPMELLTLHAKQIALSIGRDPVGNRNV